VKFVAQLERTDARGSTDIVCRPHNNLRHILGRA